MRDDRAVAGILQHWRRLVAGEQIMVRQTMLAQRRSERANDRQFVGDVGSPRQQLADLNPGDFRRDRLKRPAHFSWRSGLEIKRFQMTGTAIEPDQDAGLGFWRDCWRCRSSRAKKREQTKPQKSSSADP